MVEYKIDSASGTPYLMEINGRFWGSVQLAIDAGVDFPRLLVECALGREPARSPRIARECVSLVVGRCRSPPSAAASFGRGVIAAARRAHSMAAVRAFLGASIGETPTPFGVATTRGPS